MEQKKIIAMLVSDEDRMDFLPRSFGRRFMAAENLLYRMMEKLSDDYKGGFWQFYELDNGGFFMAPTIEKLNVSWSENYYSGTMSGEAAGIVASLFTINYLANAHADEKMTDAYYQLLDFACQHAEASEILGAID